MWSKSNWCERIILISLLSLVVLLCCNVVFDQVISNSWLILYTFLVAIFTIWITCRDIQFLLEQSVPLKTEPNDVLANYSQISILRIFYNSMRRLIYFETSPKRNDLENKERCKSVNISNQSEVKVISKVIERKCVWDWYSHYVSKEAEFPLACKQLLEQMVSKVFQITLNVDSISLYSDTLGVVLRHCKEYKRAQRRMTKIGQGRIEEYYRNSHPTSPQRNSLTTCMKGKSTQSHCLLLLRYFMKELLPWELWGTPQSLLLASILAKRLDMYVTSCLANPLWIKSKLMKAVNPTFQEESVTKSNNQTVLENAADGDNNQTTEHYDVKSTLESLTPEMEKTPPNSVMKSEPAQEQVQDPVIMETSIESALSNLISSSTAPILQRAEVDDANSKLLLQADKNVLKSKPINIVSASPLHSSKANNCGEVKIYEKVVEGSVKTWNSDNDLECVSLGHDLLASLDGDIETRFGRLWEADGVDGSESWSPNPPSTGSSTKTPHGLWFGEDDTLEMDLTDESPPKQNTSNYLSSVAPNTVLNNNHNNSNNSNSSSHSISNFNITNPLSIHNMKELQNISKNTVTQAKHKIGDLQDEAAGVMEGILDFGMAGLRKGLRLTGLQESPTDKTGLNGKLSESIPSITSAVSQVLSRTNSQTEENNVKLENPKDSTLHKVSEAIDINKPNNNSQHLVKQHRISSQDSSYFNVPSKEMDSSAKEKESSVEKDVDLSLVAYNSPSIPGTESPDYEYEEPADFASTIAKLRHLLQQKTSDLTPKTQDDSNIPDPVHSMSSSAHSRPSSATQPTNSPIHKITPPQTGNNVATVKCKEIVSSPSLEGDFGFTILSQNSSDLVEAEEALNHKIEQICVSSIPQSNVNNMQRLDKLFTRTVTGVFNTIKTAVGGDALAEGVSGVTEAPHTAVDKQTVVRAHQHKDDWIFVEGEMETSNVVGKLLMERRGFCVVETEVEAAQDMLEVLGKNAESTDKKISTPTSPCDDLDDSEVLCGCPIYQMCMELVTVVLGGATQKDAVVKCVNIVVADMVEDILQYKLINFNMWLRKWIVDAFHTLSSEMKYVESDKILEEDSQQTSIKIDQLCSAVLTIVPDILFTILGKEEISQAIEMLIMSVENPLINRDVVFNLLDVFVLHFIKACSSQNFLPTPPPSA